MSIFFAIIAFIIAGLLTFVDKLIENKVPLKIVLLSKSIVFTLFSLIVMGANKDFENGFFTDFVELEWLYLGLICLLAVISFIFFNIALRRHENAEFNVLSDSSLLFFINILLLATSFKNFIPNADASHIIYLVIELLAIIGAIIVTIINSIKNGAKVLDFVYIGIFTLSLAGCFVLKKLFLTRPTQHLDIVVCYSSFAITITSIINLFIGKIEIKKIQWQSILILVVSAAMACAFYLFATKAVAENGANVSVINMIISLSFLIPVGFSLFEKIKEKKPLLEIIMPSSFLLVGVISFLLLNVIE